MSYGLQVLAEDFGYNNHRDLIDEYYLDGLVPGICTECGYTTEYEPDQDRGWCEDCGKTTVKSALILAGLI